MKRIEKVPKLCSRCGNFLDFGGFSIFYLPYENRYITFCAICHNGLGLPEGYLISHIKDEKELKEFWDEETKKK